MEASDAARELSGFLPQGVRECTLAKRGSRADSFRATLGDGTRVLAKRFRALGGYAQNECASYRLFASKRLDVAPALRFAADDSRWLIVHEVTGRDFTASLSSHAAPESLIDLLARTLTSLVSNTTSANGDAALRTAEADTFAARWPDVMRWSEGLGVVPGPELERSVMRLLECYRRPPIVAWTQGDPAPSNVLFTDTAAVLVDFEYGGYRHALHDLTQWSVRIPLPFHWYARLEHAVGDALIRGGLYPDDAAFHEDHAAMAGYASLYMFTWLPIERALDEDAPWAPGFDARSALLSTTNRLAARLRTSAPAISEWSERMFTVLSRRWPERKVGTIDWAIAQSAIAGEQPPARESSEPKGERRT